MRIETLATRGFSSSGNFSDFRARNREVEKLMGGREMPTDTCMNVCPMFHVLTLFMIVLARFCLS